MYSILIVDDEKKERDGISKLLKRYQFDLKISQASNGEEALKEFERKSFDILLTDIKMPFMDGIQLIKEIQKRGENPICIIYSAYGEFEYAQNAISLGVLEYLLKPIRLDAFEELFNKIIELCKEKEEVEKEKLQSKRAYEEIAVQRLGAELLSYLESDYDESDQSASAYIKGVLQKLELKLEFYNNNCVPILISCYTNLFSIEWDIYQNEIMKQFGDDAIIINKADNQILVLVKQKKESFRVKEVKKQCEELINQSKRKYQTDVFIILGSQVQNLRQLKKEYDEIKDQLDYQFFVSDSMLIVHDEAYFVRKEHDMLTLYFERIYNCTKMSDYAGIKKELNKVFSYIEKQNGFSSIYVKYTFSDMIKKINEYIKTDVDLLGYIEKIYEARSFEEVSQIVYAALDDMAANKTANIQESRLIQMVKKIICEKYSDSGLGVSSIAEEINVSSAYLSSLFKIETGDNLVKYITKYRVNKSKELLSQSNMKVSDISAAVGYINASYYISIFRNHEGCSPVQYREKVYENKRL